MVRGDTAVFQLQIKTASGSAYTPTSDDKIRFAMKKRYSDTRTLIKKQINNSTLLLTLEPNDTKGLGFGDYVYDIELTKQDGTVDTIVPKACFRLLEEVE